MPDRANFAVRDGDLRIVYVTGDKGLYKLFVDSKEIEMMFAVDPAEIAHMVGYGALTRRAIAIPVSVELLMMPAQASGGSMLSPLYVMRHYTPADGIRKITMPTPGVLWGGVAVSPFNPDKWLIWINDVVAVGSAPMYLTTNAGVDWTPVTLPLPVGGTHAFVRYAAWSRHADNFLWVGGHARTHKFARTNHAWFGNPTAGLTEIEINPTGGSRYWHGSVALDNGSFYAHVRLGSERERVIINELGAFVEQVAVDDAISPPTDKAGAVNVAGSAAIVQAHASQFSGWELYHTANYLVDPMLSIGVVVDTPHIAETADGKVYLGGNDAPVGVREVLTPLTAPSVVTAAFGGQTTQAIASDRQTRTVVVAQHLHKTSNLSEFYINDAGAGWQELSLTDVVGAETGWISTIEHSFAVIVRT